MATLSDSQIADLVTGTQKRLGRMRFQQIAQDLQHYEVLGRMFKRDRISFSDGYAIQRTIMKDYSDAAKQVGLHEVDNVDIADYLTTISVPWKHTVTAYGYERRELLYNRGQSRIVDILKARRAACMIGLAEHLEDQFWAKPATGTDKLDMHGVPRWVVANATEGFNGGDPYTGYGAGDLLVADAPNWKNYTFQYATVDKNDAIKKMRTMYRKIRFKSPVNISDFTRGNADQYRFYVNEPTMQQFETLGEGQNENLGRDVASMDGVMTFRKNPIIWVPKLDDYDGTTANPANPIYALNHSVFGIAFLRGDYLRESEPRQAPDQHNSWQTFVDLTGNVICVDRRRLGVGVTAVS